MNILCINSIISKSKYFTLLILFVSLSCHGLRIYSPLAFVGNRLRSSFSFITPRVAVSFPTISNPIALFRDFSFPKPFYSIFAINLNLSGAKYEREERSVLAARILAYILKSLIVPRTKSVSGLTVRVFSASNRDILRGKVNALEIKFDSIGYNMIQITGGGRLRVERVEIQMRNLLFRDLYFLRKPYNIFADFVLTQNDIVNSSIIRHWMQCLVDNIIGNVVKDPAGFVLKVMIKRVTIRANRLFVHGEAGIVSTSTTVPFEISFGAGVRANGQVVFLQNIGVVLNPDTFLRYSVPLPLTAPVDVDIGDNFMIELLELSSKYISIRARTVVNNVSPFAVAPIVKRALHRYDLAAVLSSWLRVKGGFMRNININPLNLFRKRKQQEPSPSS